MITRTIATRMPSGERVRTHQLIEPSIGELARAVAKPAAWVFVGCGAGCALPFAVGLMLVLTAIHWGWP